MENSLWMVKFGLIWKKRCFYAEPLKEYDWNAVFFLFQILFTIYASIACLFMKLKDVETEMAKKRLTTYLLSTQILKSFTSELVL